MNAPNESAQLTIDGVPRVEQESTEAPHMIARVNSMAVKIAFPFMAQNDIRYYLNGLNVRPLGDNTVMIVATDGQDMHTAGETELARIWTKVEAIRAKQVAKPKHSPLPAHLETRS
ncbi:hypothetical protein [Paraburkholderia sediminicola]|uniref:hypothetical protein n=1 Tax=Paraburkholderia sediminicola TaxID=458836 RepID=UPI0038B886BB